MKKVLLLAVLLCSSLALAQGAPRTGNVPGNRAVVLLDVTPNSAGNTASAVIDVSMCRLVRTELWSMSFTGGTSPGYQLWLKDFPGNDQTWNSGQGGGYCMAAGTGGSLVCTWGEGAGTTSPNNSGPGLDYKQVTGRIQFAQVSAVPTGSPTTATCRMRMICFY